MTQSNIPAGSPEQEAATLALQFLSRVQLSGQEVPAFNHAMGWLESVARGPAQPEPAGTE